MKDKLLWTSKVINRSDVNINEVKKAKNELFNLLTSNHQSDFLLVETTKKDWKGLKGMKFLNLSQPVDDVWNDLLSFDYEYNFSLYQDAEKGTIYGIFDSHDVHCAKWSFEDCLDPESLDDYLNNLVMTNEKFEEDHFIDMMEFLEDEYKIPKEEIVFKKNSVQIGEAHTFIAKPTKDKLIEVFELSDDTLSFRFDIQNLSKIAKF